jgi:hypothetical protein
MDYVWGCSALELCAFTSHVFHARRPAAAHASTNQPSNHSAHLLNPPATIRLRANNFSMSDKRVLMDASGQSVVGMAKKLLSMKPTW